MWKKKFIKLFVLNVIFKISDNSSLNLYYIHFFPGNLKPIIKSQRDPPKAKAGKIQVVTGNTFDKYVMDETKEVFIEFYAPWCGHCKAIVSLFSLITVFLQICLVSPHITSSFYISLENPS